MQISCSSISENCNNISSNGNNNQNKFSMSSIIKPEASGEPTNGGGPSLDGSNACEGIEDARFEETMIRCDQEEVSSFGDEAQMEACSSLGDRREYFKLGKKLRSTSKAILFFKRAKSVLTHHGNQNGNETDNSRDRSFFKTHLSNFNSQSTTSSSASCNIGRGRSREDPRRQNTNDSSLGSGSVVELQQAQLHQVPPVQFIVPKMNTLKMPLVCLIKSLEGELMREIFIHRYELGSYLMESLKVSLDCLDLDTKFFGLKLAKSLDDQEDLRNPWLDLNESVLKQVKQFSIKSCKQIQSKPQQQQQQQQQQEPFKSIDFYLRIKFYPPNLARVQDNFLRNYLWLQLRRDLNLGKLTSSMNNLILLMACVLQYELGDFDESKVEQIQQLTILPNQDLIEEQAIELWRVKFFNCRKHQAQMQFLRIAIILETYGFDYYPVRDHQKQRAYLLGFNYAGIKTIRNGKIVHHLRWHSLSKICYERRMIIFHQHPTDNSKRKQILGFKCLSNDDCQNLYMRLLEQKYFFTVDLAYFDKSVRRPSCLYQSNSQYSSSSLPVAEQASWPQRRQLNSANSLSESQTTADFTGPSVAFSGPFQASIKQAPLLDNACQDCSDSLEAKRTKLKRSTRQYSEEEILAGNEQSDLEGQSPLIDRARPEAGDWQSRDNGPAQEAWGPEAASGPHSSGFAWLKLIESILVIDLAGAEQRRPAQQENSPALGLIVRMFLKFCLLILMLNLLTQLTNNFSTFLKDALTFSAPPAGSAAQSP